MVSPVGWGVTVTGGWWCIRGGAVVVSGAGVRDVGEELVQFVFRLLDVSFSYLDIPHDVVAWCLDQDWLGCGGGLRDGKGFDFIGNGDDVVSHGVCINDCVVPRRDVTGMVE